MKHLITLLILFFSLNQSFSQTKTIHKMFVFKKYGQVDSVLVSEVSKITFKSIEVPFGNVFDVDGNAYITVIIGDQEWMAEDLKVTHYNDGTPIPIVSQNDYVNYGAMSKYDTCASPVIESNGLYNWYAVISGKLCPTGWRVPNDSDWVQLENHLGGADYAGVKLRTTGNLTDGTGEWAKAYPEEPGNNMSSFSALPGNPYYPCGGYEGIWWCSNEVDGNSALTRKIDFYRAGVFKHIQGKGERYNLRCIRIK